MPSRGQFITEVILDTSEGTVGTTAADLEAHSFTLSPGDFVGSALPKISAWKNGGLGAITVALWEKVGDNWITVDKDGAAFELTATAQQDAIVAYGTYGVSKSSATTGVEVTVTKVKK